MYDIPMQNLTHKKNLHILQFSHLIRFIQQKIIVEIYKFVVAYSFFAFGGGLFLHSTTFHQSATKGRRRKMDNKIVFIPSETVSFHSLTLKQCVQLSIKNNWDRAIIFKMKTTRPLLFKMRPVFGMIEKNQEKTIRLIFKGFAQNEKPPCTRDRFTIVVAPAPENCVDPSRVWKQQKCPEVLTQTARKVLKIEYGEPDRSKLVSVARSPECKFTPEQLARLRKKFPDMLPHILRMLPESALDPEDPPAAAKTKSPQPDSNNNNKKKGTAKDETEESSSSSSED